MRTYRLNYKSATEFSVYEITELGTRRVDKDDNGFVAWKELGNVPEVYFEVPGLFIENGEIKESPEFLENSLKNAKETAKKMVSSKRYNTEQNFKLVTHAMSVPISRETRSNITGLIRYLSALPEGTTISFKDGDGNFVDVTKPVLEEVFSDIMDYVQLVFGLEKTKYQAINSCMSVNDIKTLMESE